MMRVYVLILLYLTPLHAEIWRSPDGKELEAVGLFWTGSGVILQDTNERQFEVEYKDLVYDDVKSAVDRLDYFANDKIKAYSKTVSTRAVRQDVFTGKYSAYVTLHTYDGYHYNGTATLRPITQKVKYSGRIVEVNLSSLRGDGLAGIEFFALRNPESPKVYHAEGDVVSFRDIGSRFHFTAPVTRDYAGWVVLVRSINTGEIVDVNSSLRHLEKYVLEEAPREASFNVDTDKIKQKILEFQKARETERLAKHKSSPKKPAPAMAGKAKETLPKLDSNPSLTGISECFYTKIDDVDGYLLKLNDGGKIEIERGVLGFIGSNKDAVVFQDSSGWRVWIEGKTVYPCTILEPSPDGSLVSCEKVKILEVQNSGKTLKTTNNLEIAVLSFHSMQAKKWLGNFEALIIDGKQLLNLDKGGKLIDIQK